MRQYYVFYKRGAGERFAKLNGSDHAKLIDHQEIKEAVEVMRQQPAIEAICVRLADELFNLVSFTQEAIAPNAFVFEPTGE